MRFVGACGLVALGHVSRGSASDWGDATCAAREPEVRFVVLDEMPKTITHELINEWSQGFRLPTVVRGAFDNSMGCTFDYLDDSVALKTKFGYLGGFNERDKTAFKWQVVRETLETQSQKIYGSFGYGTGNYEDVHKESIRRIKAAIVPELFSGLEYPGHMIFGSTNETEVSTSWHNAIDANLLFQLCGRKMWYTMEKLPPGRYPVQVAPRAPGAPTPPSLLFLARRRDPCDCVIAGTPTASSASRASSRPALRRASRTRSNTTRSGRTT